MQIFITGTSGFLGEHLVHWLAQSPDLSLIALDRSEYSPSHADVQKVFLLGERDSAQFLKNLPESIQPDFVVHCAAKSSFLGCELNPQETKAVNEEFTNAIVQFCAERSSHLIFISTDLVFDGNGPAPREGFSESVEPHPVSQYARSKLLGENSVLSLEEKGLILRVSLLYGAIAGRGGGPLRWAIEAAQAGEELTAFHDEWRTPLYVGDLVRIIEKIFRSPKHGVYHCGGPERVVRTEFFRALLECIGVEQRVLKEVSRLVVEGPIRPEDVSLCSARLRNDLEVELTPLKEGLCASVLPMKR